MSEPQRRPSSKGSSQPSFSQPVGKAARKNSASLKHLTEQQMRDLRQIFDWLDVSGDGEVSVEEVLVALSSLNSDATREDAEELVRNATGGTGKDRNIGWLDFCAIIENGITQNATAAQMFELLDTDGIGQLSPEVLRAALTKYGCDASDAAIDKMIRYIDANNDGQVSLQEFADALARKPGEVQEGERRVQSRP